MRLGPDGTVDVRDIGVTEEQRGSGSSESGVRQGTAPRLHERGYAILAARIADGSIAPGTVLLESRLAEEFGISRAPVRQALFRLAAEGLVARTDAHGYRVVANPPHRRESGASAGPAGPVRLAPAATWQRIYDEIEAEIVARTSFATWRVVESDMARHYGVSRTVARDVIARLHQRGVVRKDERSRWYARGLTPDYVAELYEMRRVLEPAALLSAAESVPPTLISEMRRHLEDVLAHPERIDGRVLDELEAELHGELLGHCGNRTLMEALRHYQSLLIAHRFLYAWAPRLFPVEPFLPEHLEIVDRLADSRPMEAAAALERHLRVSLDRAVHRIGIVADGYDPAPLPYLVRVDGQPARSD